MFISEIWDKFTEFVFWKFLKFLEWSKVDFKVSKNKLGWYIPNFSKLNRWYLKILKEPRKNTNNSLNTNKDFNSIKKMKYSQLQQFLL